MKKLNTSETFEQADYEWTAPEGYAQRYVPVPAEAIQIDHIIVNNVRLNESSNLSLNLMTNSEFMFQDNKVWTTFIPSKMTMSYRRLTLDSRGMPMVNENHVEALARYIVFILDYAEYRKGKLNRIIYKDSEELKNKAFRQARGSDNMVNWVENRIINHKLMNAFKAVQTNPYYKAAVQTTNFIGTKGS